jgi:hypothetical protein
MPNDSAQFSPRMPKTKFSASNIVVFVVIPLVLFGLMLSYAVFRSSVVRLPTRTKHNVTVKRQIKGDFGDETFGGEICTMSVDSVSIDFFCFEAGLSVPSSLHSVKFRGTDGKNALSAFNTFSQWAATARANHVEPFSKRISSDCIFSTSFVKSGKSYEVPCEFSYSGSRATLNEKFTESDIARCSELLKQLPEVNAERLAKESKAEQEQSLFKYNPRESAPVATAAATQTAQNPALTEGEGPNRIAIKPLRKTYIKVVVDNESLQPAFERWISPADGTVEFRGQKIAVRVLDRDAIQITKNGKPVADGDDDVTVE